MGSVRIGQVVLTVRSPSRKRAGLDTGCAITAGEFSVSFRHLGLLPRPETSQGARPSVLPLP
jgi:hypothetical protein